MIARDVLVELQSNIGRDLIGRVAFVPEPRDLQHVKDGATGLVQHDAEEAADDDLLWRRQRCGGVKLVEEFEPLVADGDRVLEGRVEHVRRGQRSPTSGTLSSLGAVSLASAPAPGTDPVPQARDGAAAFHTAAGNPDSRSRLRHCRRKPNAEPGRESCHCRYQKQGCARSLDVAHAAFLRNAGRD